MILYPLKSRPEVNGGTDDIDTEELLSTPPSLKAHDKFIRKANNIDSGRPILVGDEYQAEIPDFISSDAPHDYRQDCELNCWSFNRFRSLMYPEELLAEYSRLVKKEHKFEIDQGLQFLHAYDYNLAEAFQHISKFCASQGYKWNKDDKRTFKVAYQFFGKDFASINKLMKHKTLSQVVEHYYIVYKRKRYIMGDLIASPEGMTDEKSDFKSPVAASAEELVRKAKRSAIIKVQTGPKMGPKSKMPSLRKKQGNTLCTFSKTQLRELNKPHNHPLRIKEKIDCMKKEIAELTAFNANAFVDLPASLSE